MNVDITALIVAIVGSGGISSAIATLLAARKHKVEIEQLRQQVEDSKADTKIKIDEHVQKQMIELNNTYKQEFEERRKELDQLHENNVHLKQQVETLSSQISQLMSWVVYDSMRYQEWLEDELVKRDPKIVFPTFRKPPKFVEEYLTNEADAPNSTPVGFSSENND